MRFNHEKDNQKLREISPGPTTKYAISSFKLPEIYERKKNYPHLSTNPHNEGPNSSKERFDHKYTQYFGMEAQRNRKGIDSPGKFYTTFQKDKVLSSVAPLTHSRKPYSQSKNYAVYTFGKQKKSVAAPVIKKLSPMNSLERLDSALSRKSSIEQIRQHLEVELPGVGQYNTTNYSSAFQEIYTVPTKTSPTQIAKDMDIRQSHKSLPWSRAKRTIDFTRMSKDGGVFNGQWVGNKINKTSF